MDIRKHIKELLFTHDCVIIPGFGGFVTSYQPSEIQRFKNVVYPPSKSILFNRRLQTNDGVLVSQIAQQEKIAYMPAEEKVRQFADTWNRLIDNKGMLMFPDIGKIYINSSNALVFLPELRKNYLTDTFGLKPIAYQLHTESSATTAKIVKMERKPPPIEEEEETNGEEKAGKRRTRFVIGAVAAGIILFLLIPQLFLQNMLPPHMRVEQLNLMSVFRSDSSGIKAPEKKKELLRSAEEQAADTNAISDTTADETLEESAPIRATPSEESLPATGNFYIVFGSSDFVSDAIKLKKKLDEEHAKTFEVFTSDGNYVVGLRAGDSRQQAEASMSYFQGTSSDLKVVVRE